MSEYGWGTWATTGGEIRMTAREEVLARNVECPHCGSEISLDDNERIERRYTCPECGNLVDQSLPKAEEKDPDEVQRFKRQISEKSDEELFEILSHLGDYKPAFLRLVVGEIESRKIDPERRKQFEEQNEESATKLDANAQESLSLPISILMFVFAFGVPQAVLAQYYLNRGFKKKHDDCWRMMLYGVAFYALIFFIKKAI